MNDLNKTLNTFFFPNLGSYRLKKATTDVSSKVAQAEQCLVALEQQKQQDENEKQQLPHMRNPVELSKQAYERFRSHFFKERGVSQCAEPLFSRVLGHDRFFPVLISKKSGLTNIRVEATQLPLQLGNSTPQDVIAPCNQRCQPHALGHLYAGDMLGHQSADHLDHARRTHGLGGVLDRMMQLPIPHDASL